MSAQWGNLKSDRQGTRVINALRRAGCPNIGAALSWTDKSLLQIPGIGPKGVKRLRQETKITPRGTYKLDLSYDELVLLIGTLDNCPTSHGPVSQTCENLLNKVLNLRSVE